MDRTFTLKRLFINLTVLATVLGVVVAFPRISAWCFAYAALSFPALAISWFLAYFSERPRTTFGLALLGAFVGLLFSPRVLASWDGPPSWWDLYQLNIETRAISMALGALLFGVAARVVCRKPSRSQAARAASLPTAGDL